MHNGHASQRFYVDQPTDFTSLMMVDFEASSSDRPTKRLPARRDGDQA